MVLQTFTGEDKILVAEIGIPEPTRVPLEIDLCVVGRTWEGGLMVGRASGQEGSDGGGVGGVLPLANAGCHRRSV